MARKKRQSVPRPQRHWGWWYGTLFILLCGLLWSYSTPETVVQENSSFCIQLLSSQSLPPQQAHVLVLLGDTAPSAPLLQQASSQYEVVLVLSDRGGSSSLPNVFFLHHSVVLVGHYLFVGTEATNLSFFIDTLDMAEDGQRAILLSPHLPSPSTQLSLLLRLNQDIIDFWATTQVTPPLFNTEGVPFASPDTLLCL